MIRRRSRPDGLPFRLYERRGVLRYSIGHKSSDGRWTFRLQCSINDRPKIIELRREAMDRANRIYAGAPAENSFGALKNAWFAWQEAKPLGSEGRRAESTLAENRREAEVLCKAFGHMDVATMERADGYAFLDACERAGRSAKGNKELAFARTILEYGIRIGKLKTNPFDGIEKLTTSKRVHLVAQHELDLAIEVGRAMGGPQHICALALKTAWLCLKRSVEVRSLSVGQITDAGIVWKAAKRKRGTVATVGLIEWSPELRATVDEALAIRRYRDAGEWFVFGNLRGERYTKGGWKATLAKLMDACEKEAKHRGLDFQRFSLQDCRPKGVTDKIEAGHDDVQDATLHSNERMIQQVYDRRRVRKAKPVR